MGGKPNLSLYKKETLFSLFQGKAVQTPTLLLFLIVVLLAALLTLFLKTQLGLSLRATGDNEEMVRASSINTDSMKILGLALANGFVALSGGLLAQQQQFADNNGWGCWCWVWRRSSSAKPYLAKADWRIVSSVCAVRSSDAVLTFALSLGLAASDLKLFSSALVVLALAVPQMQGRLKRRRKRHA